MSGAEMISWAMTPSVANWSARSSLAPSGIMVERSQFRIAPARLTALMRAKRRSSSA